MKLIVILVIILLIFIIIKRISGNKNNNYTSQNYYHEIKNNLSTQEKYLFEQQIQSIEKINKLIDQQSKQLKTVSIETEKEIKRQIQNAENQIENYWLSKNTGFYYLIALHYQSFLLADAIKKDSLFLQNIYNNINTQISNINSKIKPIQAKIDSNQASSADYITIKQFHIVRKDLFSKRDLLNALISEKESLVTEQNKRTARRRDYIKNNFGKKGRDWEYRMKLRHS